MRFNGVDCGGEDIGVLVVIDFDDETGDGVG